MATNRQERPVVVLTEFKEIFFGWTKDTTGERIALRAARQACYFGVESHGLLGLGAEGPSKDSRIGQAADIEVRKVVNVVECSTSAVKRWEDARWA